MIKPWLRFPLAILAAGFAGMAAGQADAKGEYDIGSLASEFLQSKTRMTILERDDKADAAACKEKRFVKAAPAGPPPMSRIVDAITERKWQEIWTVERCGTDAHYLIFFTEEGSGGAYYAIVGPQTVAELEKYFTGQAPAQPATHDFMIYFDSNKFALRSDAARILDSVAEAYKAAPDKKVRLTGHTDTMGSSALNQKLAEERVRAAKAYLVRHGVPAASITTIAKGKSELRVKTADQVREQENRNVHIELE